MYNLLFLLKKLTNIWLLSRMSFFILFLFILFFQAILIYLFFYFVRAFFNFGFSENPAYGQYCVTLQSISFVKLLQKLSTVYQSMEIVQLQKLFPSLTVQEIQKQGNHSFITSLPK